MARTPEGRFQDKVYSFVEQELGGICLKNTGRQGIPDVTAYLPNGKAVVMELKCKRPTTSAYESNQEWYLSRFSTMGYLAEVVYPENWDIVKDMLEREARK